MFDTLANLLSFQLLGLEPESRIGAAVHFFIMDVAKIFVLLVVIIYVMGLLRAMLSPERVREFVRDRPDWQGRGLAVTLGAVTPFCSCSSVPLFIGFLTPRPFLGGFCGCRFRLPIRNDRSAHHAKGQIP